MIQEAGKLWGMRRLSDKNGRFKMIAVDQRPPIKNPIREIRGTDQAPWADVAGFKTMLVEELQSESSAMLLDPHFAYPAAVGVCDPEKGIILTLEDSLFTESSGGRISREIDNWSVEKIKRVGGDAVKVLAWYRPDADKSVCQRQQDFVQRIGDACQKYDLPYVFELLSYPLSGDSEKTSDYVEMKSKKPELVLESVRAFADQKFGIDVFKLESPLAAENVPGVGGDEWEEAQAWFDQLGQAAGRPWVMLSAGAGMDEFRNILTHAYKAGASGYLAGRAIWLDAFQDFPDWDAIRVKLRSDAVAYMRDINALTDAEALPWQSHSCYGQSGPVLINPDAGFRNHYSGFGGNS